MKALVVSGGGSKGAFAGGIAEYLIKDCKKEYDLFLGTSTGALLTPNLAAGELEDIKKVYTSVTNDDIFSINPFIIKKQNGQFHVSMNHLNVARMFLKKKQTFGESHNLRKLIANSFSEETFNSIRNNKKDVVVSVANLSANRMEYKSINDCSYEDFCDWVWISANMVPFMSLVTKNNYEYADGGYGSWIPLSAAIRRGATEIDVIVLKPKDNKNVKLKTSNPFGAIMNVMDFMLSQITWDDIRIGFYESMRQKVELNIYYLPRKLTDNSLVFDPKQMTQWWQDGLEYARKQEPTRMQAKTRHRLLKFMESILRPQSA